MPNRIPVHDDWGRQVGEFIPSGSEDTGVLILFVIALMLITFPLYLLYKLILDAIDPKVWKWKNLILVLGFTSVIIAVVLIAVKQQSDNQLYTTPSVLEKSINAGEWRLLVTFDNDEYRAEIVPLDGGCENRTPMNIPPHTKKSYECILKHDPSVNEPTFSVTWFSDV